MGLLGMGLRQAQVMIMDEFDGYAPEWWEPDQKGPRESREARRDRLRRELADVPGLIARKALAERYARAVEKVTGRRPQLRRGITGGWWVDAEWLSRAEARAICRLLEIGVQVRHIDTGWMEAALTAGRRERSEG